MEKKITLQIFCILIQTIAGFAVLCKASMPHIDPLEVNALLEWKANYISKTSQHVLWSWNAANTSTVCKSWVGVSCHPSGHHIQGLNLSGAGLAGSMAPHLGNLTFLSILDLSNNSFTGRIPSQLEGCIVLKMLDLHSNMLSTPIPSSLASLSSLELLNLCDNTLTGPIPLAMFANRNASRLQALGLCVNALTSSMPSDLGLHLPNLQTLLLWQNHLTGAIPPSLASCLNLIDLELHANQLSGPIPNQFHSLHNLQSLYLNQNNLTGPIPPSLSNCTSLTELTLNSNQLTGPIPSQFHLLQNLQLLYLQRNALTGPIPPSLGNCTNLVELSLHSNQLTGPIPPSLGNCTNLVHLNLDSNQLTGPIPPSLGNCIHLSILNLFSNQLVGSIPNQLSSLQNLQVLELMQNSALTGPIPLGLANCTYLTNLDLSFNQLTGHIPAQLSFLIHLEFLNLGTNRLTGIIPPALALNCTNLITLQLNNNELSGGVPTEFGWLGKFQKLQLSGNKLTGTIPLSLGNCTQLLELDLSLNQLTSTIPSSSIQMLGHLQTLQLSGNNLSGLFHLLDFSNFTNLLFLQLQSNQLSGSLSPSQFSNLQQIRFLDLGSNLLTGEFPWDAFSNYTFLFTLSLFDNRLTGGIPSGLGKYQGLQYLYLGANSLHGEIPDFEGPMRLLELDLSFNRLNGSLRSSLAQTLVTLAISLDLSHNEFYGSLPLWLNHLVMVQTIDLSKNRFTGGIPKELGDCVALTALNLSQNQLSGGLPPELGNLTYLESLDLSSNNLSGTLPSFLGTKLLHLKFLNISFNNLSGPIPTHEGVFMHLNASSFQGNPGLCGPILNKECTGTPLISKEQGHNGHHHSILHMSKWRGIVLITFSVLMVSLLLLAVSWCYFHHAKVAKERFIIRKLVGAKRYTAQELMEATQGYSEANLLGQGGLSQVYKGVLGDGEIVAVKKLKDIDNSSHEAFLREMKILSKLRHRNLVRILGCVLNLDVKALVLQYMENGSLDQYLEMHFDETGQTESTRLSYSEMVLRVAVGVAQALAYLHHEYGMPIIHGDVKPNNILFDSNFEPHLADFGLAKLIERGARAVSLSSDFKGSIGYMAPEYAYAARITTKVDVYSYGVVLLRMLTGRSPTQDFLDGLSLHEWVKSKLPSELEGGADLNIELLHASLLHKIPYHVDATTSSSIDHILAEHLLRMGVACTAQHPDDRPTIQQVLAFFHSNTKTKTQNMLIDHMVQDCPNTPSWRESP